MHICYSIFGSRRFNKNSDSLGDTLLIFMGQDYPKGPKLNQMVKSDLATDESVGLGVSG
ncbi:MAG TPA: hypothetical protein VL053_05685 [Arachidicoccus sp.]|nr:hypothetical protein [Arachidicoccus sp.]